MKPYIYCLLGALALCWTLTGCTPDADQPAEPVAVEEAAEALEMVAPSPVEVSAPAPAAMESAADIPAHAAAQADSTTIVAKVNGKEITEADVQKVMDLFMSQMGERVPADQLAAALPAIRERVIEELVMRDVMLGEVAKQNISLSDAEFNEIKAELSQELPPGLTLEDYMKETGTTEAEMREQMTIRKMIMAKAEGVERPSDEEIRAFYEENKEGFNQDETVTAAHILIRTEPEEDADSKAAKRARLEGIRQQILEGGDFAELARENSDCPSATSGGDLGTFGRGQMVSEFEDAAFSQNVGSVGDIVETQFGYHLIKVSDHSTAKTLEFDEVKDRIADLLYAQKQQDAVRGFVEEITANANIERMDSPPAGEPAFPFAIEEETVEILPEAEGDVLVVEDVVIEEAPSADPPEVVVEEVLVVEEIPVVEPAE
ncbi:MAG: peptidylprolyl isomerase [Verrucomicrobiota bacterium]|nr:peptidylprolyl isomerase [Verrucomicrobiota bacterium]